MAEIAGREGKVNLGATTVLSIDDWNLTIDIDMLQSADFGDTWKEALVGLRSASGSFSGRFDPADTTGHVALQTEALSGTSWVSLRLYVNSTNYYSGTALLTSFAPKASVDGKVDVTYSFLITGAVTYN